MGFADPSPYSCAELSIVDSLLSFSNDAAHDGNGADACLGTPLPSSEPSLGPASRGSLAPGNWQMPKAHVNIYTKVVRLIKDLTKVYDFGVEMELVSADEDLCRLLDSIQDKFKLSIHRAAASSV